MVTQWRLRGGGEVGGLVRGFRLARDFDLRWQLHSKVPSKLVFKKATPPNRRGWWRAFDGPLIDPMPSAENRPGCLWLRLAATFKTLILGMGAGKF